MWKDRIFCKTEMQCFSQLYNWILLRTIPLKSSKHFGTTMQTALPPSFHKYYWTVMQEMWNHSWPSLPIMTYCLPSMVLIMYCKCSHLQKKTGKLSLIIFSLWSNIFSFVKGKLWRRHFDVFLHRDLSKKSRFFFSRNESFWPESNSYSTNECMWFYRFGLE